MGFFAVSDCVVGEAVAVVAGSASAEAGDTIDSNNRRKLTAARNATLNNRPVTLNNSDGESIDVRRHCDVGGSPAALRNSVRSRTSFDASNRAAVRATGSPACASDDVLDIRRKVRRNNAEDSASSSGSASGSIQSMDAMIGRNICLDRRRARARRSRNCFDASALVSSDPNCSPAISISPLGDDNLSGRARSRRATLAAAHLLCKCSAIFPTMETTCRSSIRRN